MDVYGSYDKARWDCTGIHQLIAGPLKGKLQQTSEGEMGQSPISSTYVQTPQQKILSFILNVRIWLGKLEYFTLKRMTTVTSKRSSTSVGPTLGLVLNHSCIPAQPRPWKYDPICHAVICRRWTSVCPINISRKSSSIAIFATQISRVQPAVTAATIFTLGHKSPLSSKGLQLQLPSGYVNSSLLKMAIEIVDLLIKNGGSFHSYVKLPEGTDSNHGEKSYLNITKQQLLNYLRQPSRGDAKETTTMDIHLCGNQLSTYTSRSNFLTPNSWRLFQYDLDFLALKMTSWRQLGAPLKGRSWMSPKSILHGRGNLPDFDDVAVGSSIVVDGCGYPRLSLMGYKNNVPLLYPLHYL